MMEAPAYGLWAFAILNSAVVVLLAFSFARPHNARDWRSFGVFTAFVVAFFTEMYGFPLTIYLLAGWLVSRYPGMDLFAHNNGHLWQALPGWGGDPHLNPLHLLSYVIVALGFFMLANAWRVLYRAQRAHRLAATSLYARMRHPQYVGLGLIMLGFLLQWPTMLTLLMFPVLIVMYARLAQCEEQEMLVKFGEEYAQYAVRTPAFFPRLRQTSSDE